MKHPRLQSSVLTLFADLAQRVDSAPEAGSVYRRSPDGIEYICAKVPVGQIRVDRFVGKSGDPEAEAKAEQLKLGVELARERRKTIGMLRKYGLAAPDQTLGATLDAIAKANLFRNGAVLVGTGAYMMLEPLVGRRLPSPTLMTGDLDLATARLALSAEPPEPMEKILRRADSSFVGVMQLDPGEPPSRFRNDQGYLVDLLTPMRHRDDRNPRHLDALGAGAAPLQHLAWLIADPVSTVALWGAGIAVNVPQPARFAVHKLILAQRRDMANRVKRTKDLDQAKALIEALLEHDRFALEDAIDDARSEGRDGWRTPIARSLAEIGHDL